MITDISEIRSFQNGFMIYDKSSIVYHHNIRSVSTCGHPQPMPSNIGLHEDVCQVQHAHTLHA